MNPAPDYSNYRDVQKYRRSLLDQIRDPRILPSTKLIIAEFFMSILEKIPYDVNQLWSERAELYVVLDDMNPETDPIELINLYKSWYTFVDEELKKRMTMLGEVPDIFNRIKDTLDEW